MSKHTPKPMAAHAKPKGKIADKPAPKTKSAFKTKPTSPNHDFPPPYNRLMLIGEHELEEVQDVYKEIAAMFRAGDPHEAVARLTAIALDESYYEYENLDHPDPKETRTWTRLHAIGVLSCMGPAASAAIEPLLPLLDEEDDWLREEMPLFYASLGEPAIEPLRRLLHDPEADTYMRTGAGDSLEQIAETHPALRPAIIPLLEQALVNAGKDELLAAFVVCNLLDLNAKESLALIQQAFEEERVDESVVEIRDVEEHFGLVPIKTRVVKLSSLPEEQNKAHWLETDDADEQALLEEESASEASVPYVKPVKLGRNEPCWCGSGKKFKQCHG